MERLPLLKNIAPPIANVNRTYISFFEQSVIDPFCRLDHQIFSMKLVPVCISDEGLLNIVEERSGYFSLL